MSGSVRAPGRVHQHAEVHAANIREHAGNGGSWKGMQLAPGGEGPREDLALRTDPRARRPARRQRRPSLPGMQSTLEVHSESAHARAQRARARADAGTQRLQPSLRLLDLRAMLAGTFLGTAALSPTPSSEPVRSPRSHSSQLCHAWSPSCCLAKIRVLHLSKALSFRGISSI